jgi:hypothetical protein
MLFVGIANKYDDSILRKSGETDYSNRRLLIADQMGFF